MPELRDGDALIKVRHAGICGSELSGYLGTNSLRKPPLVMGHEFSGEIVQLHNVSEFEVGQLVTANPIVECGRCDKCLRGQAQHCPNKEFIGVASPGAFAEYVRVPARALLPVSDPVSGALVEPLACSVRAVRQSGLVVGDSVVLFGAGIIGLFAMKVAELSGASTRILVDTNAERLEIGRGFGATHLVNASQQNAVSVIHEIVDGKVSKVIDAVGAPIVRQQAIQVVENTGTVVFVGLHHDETTIPGNVIVRNEIRIVGSFAYNHDDFSHAHALFEAGSVEHEGSWLDNRHLKHAAEAFEEQIYGRARFPKILLTPFAN